MMRSPPARALGWLGLAWISAAAPGTTGSKSPASPPHLVFVMADDLGWANVGYHNSHAITPHLDRLASEGVELDRHYAYYYCAPTRASFLTGRCVGPRKGLTGGCCRSSQPQ